MFFIRLFKKKQKTLIAIEEPKPEENRLRISHTVYPDERLPFNDYWQYVYSEVKKDFCKKD